MHGSPRLFACVSLFSIYVYVIHLRPWRRVRVGLCRVVRLACSIVLCGRVKGLSRERQRGAVYPVCGLAVVSLVLSGHSDLSARLNAAGVSVRPVMVRVLRARASSRIFFT